MDIESRIVELEREVSRLKKHLRRLVPMIDRDLQPSVYVMLELDASAEQETAVLDLLKSYETPSDLHARSLTLGDFYAGIRRIFPDKDSESAGRSIVIAFEKQKRFLPACRLLWNMGLR